MKIVINYEHEKHNVETYARGGVIVPGQEIPERGKRFIAALSHGDHEEIRSQDFGMGPIADVHSVDYLEFLQNVYQEWQDLPNPPREIVPFVHPVRYMDGYSKHIIAKVGYHVGDTASPIVEGTWQASYASAQTALTAAKLVADGASASYAMCRPPGHHAYSDLAGGYCYINNVAVAAEYLLKTRNRVAILDVDVHHGNGTQGIFYNRADVAFVSLHGEPDGLYPFYSGFANERGEGLGRGYNRNFPMPAGTGDNEFLNALQDGLRFIDSFAPDALLISLGLDAQENDPVGNLSVSTKGFEQVGAAIGEKGLPTVIIQEGGYLCDELADNLVSFLAGFENSHD